jgi:aerobic-type carbon monoxide dehydrogenase small subunit (CoxS/CutS family)
MIMSAVSLLNNRENPADAEILQFMQGNICRCGTYPRIVAAIRKASAAGKEPVR